MGLSDIVVYDSVKRSNIPHEEKSLMLRWFEKMTGILPHNQEPQQTTGISKEHVVSAVQAFRQSLESNAVSFGLGVLHAEAGLDVGKMPVDLVGGTVLTLGSIALAKNEVSRDLLNMGTAAQNCFSFRKGHAWSAARQVRQGNEPASKMGEVNIAGEGDTDDPIVQVAKTIEQK